MAVAAKTILMLVGDYVEDPHWLAKFLHVLGTRIQP
jgi:hypothetical protein